MTQEILDVYNTHKTRIDELEITKSNNLFTNLFASSFSQIEKIS